MKQKKAWIVCVFFYFFYMTVLFFFKKKMLFMYFWLHWVFVALCGLSLVTLHCRARASHCGSFVLLWSTGSRVLGLQ